MNKSNVEYMKETKGYELVIQRKKYQQEIVQNTDSYSELGLVNFPIGQSFSGSNLHFLLSKLLTSNDTNKKKFFGVILRIRLGQFQSWSGCNLHFLLNSWPLSRIHWLATHFRPNRTGQAAWTVIRSPVPSCLQRLSFRFQQSSY